METSHSKAWRSRYTQNAAVCSFRNACALQNLNIKSPLVRFYRHSIHGDFHKMRRLFPAPLFCLSLSFSWMSPVTLQGKLRAVWTLVRDSSPPLIYTFSASSKGRNNNCHIEALSAFGQSQQNSLTQRAEFILREGWTCKM